MKNSGKKNPAFKRLLALAMVICMMIMLIPTVSAADKKSYVALGDSISTGYGLGEGEKSFTQQVAEANDYELKSFAEDGATTASLVQTLQKPEVMAAVSAADVITITIGGNDFVNAFFEYVARSYTEQNPDDAKTAEDIKNDILGNKFAVLQYALSISNDFGSSPEAQAALQGVQTNFPTIIKSIKDLNSQALVILTNQYNPYGFAVDQLQGTDAYTLQFKALEAALNSAIQQINTSVAMVCVQMGCSVADIYTPFDAAESNPCNPNLSMIALNLDFHPNALGHTIIAETINAMLPAAEYQLGDVNHDGKVDINDVTLIQLYIAKIMPENFDAELADVNNDGEISIYDATLIQMMISKTAA